jgi:aspartyl-tRNA(Asn)/glutamyl-tRNA(Gln) amidotransferase subunit A
MTKSVEDCALLFEAIAGHDPRDPYTSRQPVAPFRPRDGLSGCRIGVVQEAIAAGAVEAEVKSALEAAVAALEEAGASAREVSIPLFPYGGLLSNTVADAEAAYVHRHWLRAHAGEYDVASRRRLLAASLTPAPLYQKALKFRALMRRQVLAALEQADVLVLPTQAGPAPKIATTTGMNSKADVLHQFFGVRAHRGLFNLAGVPAMSVPCGFTSGGLPAGMQLAGRPFDEAALFQVGHAYQQRTPWHTRRPPL